MSNTPSDLKQINLDAILKDYQSEAYLNNMLKDHKEDFDYTFNQDELKKECEDIKLMCQQISVECSQFASVLESFKSRQDKIKKSTETVKETVGEVKSQVAEIKKKLADAEIEMKRHKSKYSQLIADEEDKSSRSVAQELQETKTNQDDN